MSRHFRHKQDLAADASNALSNMKEKARKHGTQMLKSNIGGSMALEFDPGVETALGNYNSGSWARTFCTLKPRVMPVIPIAFIMTIAVSWSFLFKVLEYAFNVDAMVLQSNLGIPATALSILGSTIGFVLCVRLNNANGQWWEGRGHFGKAVSNSVDVTGIFCASCTANTNGAVQRFVGTHCLAFVVTLKNLLRTDEQDDSDDAAELRQFMAPNDYEFVMSANSEYRPMLVLQLLRTVISKLAAEEKLPQLTAQTLLSALSDMNDAYYSCLKVKKSPIPVSYLVHLRTLIIAYLVCFPLGLIGEGMDIWKVMIAVFIVGFSLIGLEDIGNRLEDPFGTDVADIPLNTLSVNAFHSIKETLVCHMLVAERIQTVEDDVGMPHEEGGVGATFESETFESESGGGSSFAVREQPLADSGRPVGENDT